MSAERNTSTTAEPARIAPIETRYDGCLFRSRTEARWAVFFNTIGLRWEYEKEGYALPSGWYLPDFWLPDIGCWMEIKGAEPTPAELCLCAELTLVTAKRTLLAVGSPTASEQIMVFTGFKGPVDKETAETSRDFFVDEAVRERFYLADDRKNDGEFWLASEDRCFSIGPVTGPDHGRYPGVYSATERGYKAAKSVRFEKAGVGRRRGKRS